MNNLNEKQAYKLGAVLVVGGIAGIVFFGNKTPQKNPFDRTGPPYVHIDNDFCDAI